MQIVNTLRTHLDRLNEIPIFRSSIKIFIPENNLANEGSHMWHAIKDRSDVRCFWQKQDRPGVCKDRDTADEFQYIINVKLKNSALHFDREFFTTSTKHTAASIKGQLREQMERYHYEYESAKTLHGKDRQTITGKGGTTDQDDLMIGYAMNVFWPRMILKDPRNIR